MASSLSSLATLLKQTYINDDEEVLRAANSALKQSKGDLEAQHVKLVALLKLDRYEEALKTLEAGGERLRERARLEYAYALYKSGKPKAAADIAKSGSERGLQHVEAQARYRLEDFERAAELYQALDSNLEIDAEADLRINSGAVDAQLEWAGHGELVRKKKPSLEDLEAFETAYNAACASIARGELAQGDKLLKRAKTLCNSLEDLSDEEKRTELVPITIQQLYVLTKLGRLEEVESLAQSIDVKDITDSGTQRVARLNVSRSSTTNANPFLIQRLVAGNPRSSKADELFAYQSNIMEENQYASNLEALKYSGVVDSTAQLLTQHQSPNIDAFLGTLSVVNAAAHARNQIGKEALKHILPIVESKPTDVGLILTVVQLYIFTGNSVAAVNLLESFLARIEQSGNPADQDVRFAPGLVAALVSCYETQGRKGQIRNELAKAATHWRRKPKDRSPGIVRLLKAAGSSLLESEDPGHKHLAHDIFAELSERDSSDRYVSAGLVAASSQNASGDQVATLTPIDKLLSGVDANALENAGVAQLQASGSANPVRKRPAEEGKPKKSKKIRKNRLPKNYDPSKTPDPERWLPLRDRSTYRPKGKKGKARQALLSQGAVANESEGSRPATPGGEVVKQKQGGGGGANKKKKGKGGKW